MAAPFYIDDNKPFLGRHETMSLDIIRPKDIPKGRVMYVKDDLASLNTHDIHKAKPHYEHLKYLNKEDVSVGCTDPTHAGGAARSYYPPMDRRPRDLSLTVADIELAQPKSRSWKGNRHTDPVCPNYDMPSYLRREATPPRWNGRHSMDVSDIELSRPRVLHPERNYDRDPNDARDIEFASANYRERMARQKEAEQGGPRQDRSLSVADINAKKPPPGRGTCPLDPVYKVPTNRTTSLHAKYNEEHAMGLPMEPVAPEEHGAVHGSKPRKLHWDNGEPQFSLMREDIAGTVPQRWVGSVPHNIYDAPEVRSMMSFHDPCDIPGAQVGTLRKGIVSMRQCNPLNPRYPMLDGDNKPPHMPVVDAERQGPGALAHPLVRSQQAGSSSLPNLRSTGAAAIAQSYLVRDQSHGQFRQGSDHGSNSGRPSQAPSGRATPQHYQGPSGHQLMQHGVTLRLPQEGSMSGEMSRRSSAHPSHRGVPVPGRY